MSDRRFDGVLQHRLNNQGGHSDRHGDGRQSEFERKGIVAVSALPDGWQ
jgi:hypothetical protein